MRATQLFPRCHCDPDQTIFVVVVPIHCKCTAPLMKNRYNSFRNLLGVRVNGLVIGDADAQAVTYTADGNEAGIEFTGSVPTHAANAKEAVRKVMDAHVEVFGWVNGDAHDVEIRVNGPLTLVSPLAGSLTKVQTPEIAASPASCH